MCGALLLHTVQSDSEQCKETMFSTAHPHLPPTWTGSLEPLENPCVTEHNWSARSSRHGARSSSRWRNGRRAMSLFYLAGNRYISSDLRDIRRASPTECFAPDVDQMSYHLFFECAEKR